MFSVNHHYLKKQTLENYFLDGLENIDNTQVPLFLIGDPEYPLMPWVMKAYPGNRLTEEQKLFNYRLSRACMTIECAFGRLKGRWKCLLKRLGNDVQGVSGIVIACSTLHNVWEVNGDCFDDQWLEGVEEGNMRDNLGQNYQNSKGIRSAIT